MSMIMNRDAFLNTFLQPGMALVMRGVPGSGKSTLAKAAVAEMQRRFPLNREMYWTPSADNYHMVTEGDKLVYRWNPANIAQAHTSCLRDYVTMAQEMSESCSILVCDNTNKTNVEAAPYVAVAAAYGWNPVVVHVVCEGLTKAMARNVHGVDPATISIMADCIKKANLELPRNWQLVTIVEGDTDG